MLLPLLLASLIAADTVPEPPTRQLGPSFVVQRQPAVPIVALRMAVLADDPAGHAGAGHLMQHLMLPSLEEQVGRVGGTVQIQRSSDAMIYTVTGPAVELDYLAGVLRGALRAPPGTAGAVLSANRELREERLAEWENAREHVRAGLRARLFPNDLSAAGTERSAPRLTAAALPGLWASMYRPERVLVVAVGDVREAQLEAAFAGLPPRPAARLSSLSADTISLAPLAVPQATRGWLGRGYLASDLEPAALSVAARLLRDDLRRRLPRAEIEAEHWWTHHGQGLALVVSAQPADTAAARRALDTAPATLQGSLQERRVRDAARAIRRDMLFYSRTPDRMAQVLGEFADREGNPDAAQLFYARLDAVDLADVREALAFLSEHTPVRVELTPQRLNRS